MRTITIAITGCFLLFIGFKIGHKAGMNEEKELLDLPEEWQEISTDSTRPTMLQAYFKEDVLTIGFYHPGNN